MSLQIKHCRIEYAKAAITDRPHPRLTYCLVSDEKNVTQSAWQVRMEGWDSGRREEPQKVIVLEADLVPMKHYTVGLMVWDSNGNSAAGTVEFDTGKMGGEWQADWISDRRMRPDKKKSPVPMGFRRKFQLHGTVKKAWLSATAVGIYYLNLNKKRVGEDLFAPGWTSYTHILQYQMYDVTEDLREESELLAVVGGGWAVGVFGIMFQSGAYHDRQLFLAELRIEYEDGRIEMIGTDDSWESCVDGPYTLAGFYEGVDYDARKTWEKADWKKASVEQWRRHPKLTVNYGTPARKGAEFPGALIGCNPVDGNLYDFGQNCSGVTALHIRRARAGQEIVIRCGEWMDGDRLMTANLSKARAEIHYICTDGEQYFVPELTYMGFQYAAVQGIVPEDLEIIMISISSITEPEGYFHCSNEQINRLQNNLLWSGMDNFVDLPTDCPQRDERLGWTGDIAMFASAACANFDMERFLEKWLLDVSFEQSRRGDVASVVPAGKTYMPNLASSAGWSDAASMVPWAMYQKNGDLQFLRDQYETMKKLLKSEIFWSKWMSRGKNRYIFKGLGHLGDWLAPEGNMKSWKEKGPLIGTAYYFHTCRILEKTAAELGDDAFAKECRELAENIEDAFRDVFTDKRGRLKEEFQTGYVLPIYFGMLSKEERIVMGERLAELVRQNDDKIGTGFVGTPFLLFALSDTGHEKEAWRMLLQDQMPGWMYEVKLGATTVWECWDGLLENGKLNLNTGRPKLGRKPPEGAYDPADRSLPGLSSLNHYAYGAVGDWFYRRIAGIESLEPGYRRFRVAPMPGGGLTEISCGLRCLYGEIKVDWRIEDDVFYLSVLVPVGTVCTVVLPDQTTREIDSGMICMNCSMRKYFVETAKTEEGRKMES